MITDKENEAENEKQITQIRHKYGGKYTKFKMSQYKDG